MPLLILSIFLAFSPSSASAASPPPASVSTAPAVPTDLVLRTGETYVRSVASGSPTIPPAHVIRLLDGKIAISWKGARTVPYDAIATKPETGEELIRFVNGSLLFRVMRGGEAYFVVQVIERPDTGIFYLMARASNMELSVVTKEHELLCLEIITTIPVPQSADMAYVVQIPPVLGTGFGKFSAPRVDGTPHHLALLSEEQVLFVQIRENGALIDTWLYPYSR